MTSIDRRTEKHGSIGEFGALTPRRQPSLELRKKQERQHVGRLWFTDVTVVVAAVGAAMLVQGQLVPPEPSTLLGRLLVAGVTIIVWLVALAGFGAHQPRIMGSGAAEYKRILHASAVAFGLLSIVFVLGQWPGLRMQVLIALPIGLLTLVISRWRWRHWLHVQRDLGSYTSRTLVVGRRADIEYVIAQLRTATDGYTVVGVTVTDDHSDSSITVQGVLYPVVAEVDIASAARMQNADTIVVASVPVDDPNFVRRLSWELEGTASELILSSRLTDIAGPRVSLSPLEGLPLIHVQIPTFEGAKHTLKRLLDVLVASIASIAVGVLTPFIALAIRIDSKGPVFFRQRRVGRDGQEFTMYKFRSMTDTAEQELDELLTANQGAGPLFKMKSDPRVTRVGRVLRKYSIDELPQFFNVLKGDMSIAGPRPPLPSEVRNYEGRVFRRLYIKPGITGLWQVSGRSDLSWEESVTLDLRYVENWSVTLDLMIMWRTVKVMLRPAGAY